MSSIFPLPRAQLPEAVPSKYELRALKRMIQRMLKHTVEEFDRHTHGSGGAVDASKWKALGTKDDFRVFREREAGTMSAALAPALDKTEVLSHGSTVAPLAAPGVLMTGFARGKVENVMDVVTTRSQEDLALELSFMYHEDVVDCALLHTIEAPSESDPFHFLGVKYFVRKSTALKCRDFVYLDYTGYTQTARGERLGFHLMHSIDVANYPDLPAFNSMRTLQSVRYLYRQQSDDVVEVFMQGNVDIPSTVVKSFTTDMIFSVTNLVACAEAKRLTQMWKAYEARNLLTQEQRTQQDRRAALALECSMCRQKKKLFGGATIAACGLCGEFTCSRCRSEKRVFRMQADGVLGKFRKLSVCKVCMLAANKPLSQPTDPQMVIVMSEQLQLDREASRERRRRGTSSTASSDGRSRSGSNAMSTSSDEPAPTPRTTRRGRAISTTSSASTVSAASYRDYPVAPVSPMGMRTPTHGHQPVSPMGMRAPTHGHQPVYAENDGQIELQLQRYGPRSHVQASTERAHRIQHYGNAGTPRVQQQHAPRKHLTKSMEPTEAVQSRVQALALTSRHDKALRRTASTGSTVTTSSSADFSAQGYQTGSAPTPSLPAGASTQQTDLFTRMLELNRVAESTYNTTQRNNAYVAQQLRSARKN